MYKKLSEIPYGYKPKVLFVGNGINRAYRDESWDSFIKTLSKTSLSKEDEDIYQKLPYPLRPVVITKDNVKDALKERAQDIIDTDLSSEQKKQYKDLCLTGVDAILTTNYTYDIEKSLCDDFSVKISKGSKYRVTSCDNNLKRDMCLHQYMSLPGIEPSVWHVHRECAKPDTMVLGHYYYGKLMSKFPKLTADFLRRYTSHCKDKTPFVPKSWIDYFLLGDIYFVGFGLGFDETDIWWLLNWRKLHMNSVSKAYFFEARDIKNEMDQKAKFWMADTFDINVSNVFFEEKDYKNYYKKISKYLKGSL